MAGEPTRQVRSRGIRLPNHPSHQVLLTNGWMDGRWQIGGGCCIGISGGPRQVRAVSAICLKCPSHLQATVLTSADSAAERPFASAVSECLSNGIQRARRIAIEDFLPCPRQLESLPLTA